MAHKGIARRMRSHEERLVVVAQQSKEQSVQKKESL